MRPTIDAIINPSGQVIFSLEEVNRAAREILDRNPEPIPACRLLGEVLRKPSNDQELIWLKTAAQDSKWVRQLQDSQLQNGSWGRFHTQDTKVKTIFRTTEEAIDRALVLGQEPKSRILTRLVNYIRDVLCGDAQITDWYEKNEAFPLLIKHIVAGRLAQINPADKLLDAYWLDLVEIANKAFTSGNYRLQDEAAAYLNLFNIHVPGGFLESQHALWILSSRRLPHQLDNSIVDWIWNKQDGIRYLRAPLHQLPHRNIGYWLRSMNVLARFSSWRETSREILNRIWKQRDQDGWWDFGSEISRSVDFPLSSSWRNKLNRKIDYSTCILVLLRKYFD